MKTIKELINKIKYDKREKSENYVLYYLDRIENKYKEIKFNNIKKIEGNFLILKDKEIPLHRIKIVKKDGMIIWRRIL